MSQTYRVTSNKKGHHFELGTVVTRLSDDGEHFARVKLLAALFGVEKEMAENDVHTYMNMENGLVQVLEASEVEAL